MPTGSRIRADNVFGTLTDNPLLVGATTMNGAGLANLPAVTSNHAVIVLDPLRTAGAPEIVIVTAHTAAATSATITRGAYGTTARQHAAGVLWIHAPTIEDTIRIVTSSTRPSDPYLGQLIYETDTDSYVGRGAGAVWQTLLTLGAWTAYTPTLAQSVTVTKTVTYARYARVGRLIVAQALLTITGAGTAGTAVAVGLPVAATASAVATAAALGSFSYTDTGTAVYSGTANFIGVSAVAGQAHNLGAFIGQTPSFAAANTDVVSMTVTYEAAS